MRGNLIQLKLHKGELKRFSMNVQKKITWLFYQSKTGEYGQEHKEVYTKIKSVIARSQIIPWPYFQLFNWGHLIRTIVHFTDSFRLVLGPCDDARTHVFTSKTFVLRRGIKGPAQRWKEMRSGPLLSDRSAEPVKRQSGGFTTSLGITSPTGQAYRASYLLHVTDVLI